MATNTQQPTHGWPDEWPKQLLADNPKVLQEILKAHGTFLRNTVCSCFATLTMFADDMVQTALVRVWNSRQTFDQSRGGEGFRPWLFAILRNTCLDFLRSNLHRSMELESATFSTGRDDGVGVPEPTNRRHPLERSPDDDTPGTAPTREEVDLIDILNGLPVIKRRIILFWSVHRVDRRWAEELHHDLLAEDPPTVIKAATLRVHRQRIWLGIRKELRARGHTVPDEPFDEPLPSGPDAQEVQHDAAADQLEDLNN